MMLFPNLFSEISICKLVLKNRIVMAPMATGFFERGQVTSEAKSFYLARAKGGVGLIIVGGVYITWPDAADILSIGRHAHMKDDSVIKGWQELIQELHQYGAKVGVQLFHPGRQVNFAQWGEQAVGPSSLSCPGIKMLPRELTIEKIDALVEIFCIAAQRAEEAGFDLIEIHGAHGYLVSSFMSPHSNRRQDIYGGTLEKRACFALQIIKRTKEKLNLDIPLGIRINGKDNIDGGASLAEGKSFATILEASGIDFLDISAGVYGSYPPLVPMAEQQGCFIPLAEAIKKVVRLPVIGVGRIRTPEFAEQLIRERKVDLVALGRGLIADPHWSTKAALGKPEDIRMCISCNQGCLDRIEQINFYGQPVSITCLLNPEVGLEKEIIPATISKNVLVIGGGPAGLTASKYAAKRGHKVILIEKEQELGGQLKLAAIPPYKQDIKEAVAYMTREALQEGVEIRVGKIFSKELIRDLKPQIVIVATGGRTFIPNILGIQKGNVVTAHEVLSGEAQVGERVLIVGGGLVGLETADYLSSSYARLVQVLEMTDRFATDMGSVAWMSLKRRLERRGVKLTKSCEVKEIMNEKVRVIRQGQEEMIEGMDTIVLSVGVVSENALFKEIKNHFQEVYLIGDAAQPGNALAAIHEGKQIASLI